MNYYYGKTVDSAIEAGLAELGIEKEDAIIKVIDTEAIIEFNRRVKDDARVDNVIVPIRDGINIIRVK